VIVSPDLGSSPRAHALWAQNPVAIARSKHHKMLLFDFTAIFGSLAARVANDNREQM
jgi:hypothetical protein